MIHSTEQATPDVLQLQHRVPLGRSTGILAHDSLTVAAALEFFAWLPRFTCPDACWRLAEVTAPLLHFQPNRNRTHASHSNWYLIPTTSTEAACSGAHHGGSQF